jgi:hypothetical protein
MRMVISKLHNKKMDSSVYALRSKVIGLIREAGRLFPLPRVEVRVTDNDRVIAGVAMLGKSMIWITEAFVASRQVVFHEILHAVFSVQHVAGCPMMSPVCLPCDDSTADRLFVAYASRASGRASGVAVPALAFSLVPASSPAPEVVTTALDKEREAGRVLLAGLLAGLLAEFEGKEARFLATLSDSQRAAYFDVRDAGRACRLANQCSSYSYIVAELAKARKRWMADRATSPAFTPASVCLDCGKAMPGAWAKKSDYCEACWVADG